MKRLVLLFVPLLAAASLEAQVAILKLIQRFPNLRLAEPDAAPPKRTLPFFNGIERLELLA